MPQGEVFFHWSPRKYACTSVAQAVEISFNQPTVSDFLCDYAVPLYTPAMNACHVLHLKRLLHITLTRRKGALVDNVGSILLLYFVGTMER